MSKASSFAFVGAPSARINSASRLQQNYYLTQNKCTPDFSIQDLPSIITAEATNTAYYDAGTPSVVFEPVLPQTETLVGMGVIVILCVAVSWVWANQVVPVSRTKLAIDKSRGEVKEYLDELKASDPSLLNADDQAVVTIEGGEAASIVDGNNDDGTVLVERKTASTPTAPADDRAFERWLFTDWLQDNKSARKAGRQKEPAIPILKDAKWNSGDNPVLVASTLIGLGVIFTALTERAFS